MRITEFDKYGSYINSTDLANVLNVNNDKYGTALYNLNESLVLSPASINESLYKIYIPTCEETPLMVAYNLYNDIRLYWIILKLNNITDSFKIFTPKDKVKYLDKTVIDNILESM